MGRVRARASRRTASSKPSPPAPAPPPPNPPFSPSLARLLRRSRLSSAAPFVLLVPLKTHRSHSLSQRRAVRWTRCARDGTGSASRSVAGAIESLEVRSREGWKRMGTRRGEVRTHLVAKQVDEALGPVAVRPELGLDDCCCASGDDRVGAAGDERRGPCGSARAQVDGGRRAETNAGQKGSRGRGRRTHASACCCFLAMAASCSMLRRMST